MKKLVLLALLLVFTGCAGHGQRSRFTAVILLALLLVFTGCAATLPVPVVPEKVAVFDSYETGRIMTAYVGEPIVHFRVNVYNYPGFEAVRDFSIPIDPGISPFAVMPIVEKGSKWIALSKTTDGNFLCTRVKEPKNWWVEGGAGHRWKIGLLVNPSGEAIGSTRCIYRSDTAVIDKDTSCGAFTGSGGYIKDAVRLNEWLKSENFLTPVKIAAGQAAFGMEIIYTGKSKNNISFIYRQTWQKDLALSYDIDESNVIGIGGIEIEIIEAANTHIKFIIKTPVARLRELMQEKETQHKSVSDI